MLNAPVNKDFLFEPFIIGKTVWQILINPNGTSRSDIGSFYVFCYLTSMPSTWKDIVTTITINSPQTKSSQTILTRYTKEESSGWYTNALSLQKINHAILGFTIYG